MLLPAERLGVLPHELVALLRQGSIELFLCAALQIRNRSEVLLILQREPVLLLSELCTQAVSLRMVRPSSKCCAYELQDLAWNPSLTLLCPDGHASTQRTHAPRTVRNCDKSDGAQLLCDATFSIKPLGFFPRLCVFRTSQFFQHTDSLLASPVQRFPLPFALGSLLPLACKLGAQ
jgi:hypothetical protein